MTPTSYIHRLDHLGMSPVLCLALTKTPPSPLLASNGGTASNMLATGLWHLSLLVGRTDVLGLLEVAASLATSMIDDVELGTVAGRINTADPAGVFLHVGIEGLLPPRNEDMVQPTLSDPGFSLAGGDGYVLGIATELKGVSIHIAVVGGVSSVGMRLRHTSLLRADIPCVHPCGGSRFARRRVAKVVL